MNSAILKLSGQNNYVYQEALKVLRTNILFCGKDVKIIALTSCDMNEGKTTIALSMGYSLAELGKRVLVIDADMRKSVMLGRDAKAENVKGLSELLSGQEKLADCICTTQVENLHVLFAGKYPPNPVELLNGRHFDILISAVRDVYDYILVDTPPLGMVIDAAVISAKCDSAILIIGSDNVKRSKARETVEQLKKSGCNVLGVILNNAEDKKTSYYSKKYK